MLETTRRRQTPMPLPVQIAPTPPGAPASEWALMARVASGDADALAALCESGLTPDDFTVQELRPIVQATHALTARGATVDLAAIYNEVARTAEGRDNFSIVNEQFTGALPSHKSADALAEEIAENARTRDAQMAIFNLSVAARREGATADDLQRRVQDVALRLRTRSTQASRAEAGTAQPLLVTLADVNPERPRPLWPGYLWLGKIAVLDGDPGLGKSTLTLDLAARITTGREMPDGTIGVPAADVILLSAEDGASDTIRPRLDAAGGDAHRVHLLGGWQRRDPHTGEIVEHGMTLPNDLPMLEDAIQRTSARLVVIDPLMAFLGGDVNSYRDQDVRGALRPLAALAERVGTCVLIVRHLNKAVGASALYRGGGSIGIIGAARSGLLVAPDPDDPDATKPGGARVLALAKSNLGPPMPSLRFTTVDTGTGASRIEWRGAVEMSASQLVAPIATVDERTLTDEATEYLTSALAVGPRRANEVQDEAPRELRGKPLRRAAERLAVSRSRIGFGRGSYIEWSLPSASESHSTHRCPPSAINAIDAHQNQWTPMDDEGIYGANELCSTTGGKHVTARLRTADGWLRCIECDAITNQHA